MLLIISAGQVCLTRCVRSSSALTRRVTSWLTYRPRLGRHDPRLGPMVKRFASLARRKRGRANRGDRRVRWSITRWKGLFQGFVEPFVRRRRSRRGLALTRSRIHLGFHRGHSRLWQSLRKEQAVEARSHGERGHGIADACPQRRRWKMLGSSYLIIRGIRSGADLMAACQL